MPFRYDPERGWIYEDPAASVDNPVSLVDLGIGLTPAEEVARNRQREGEAAFAEEKAKADTLPSMPFIADSPGQAISEVGKVLGNAGVALVTDYMDLAAGLGDVIGETADAILPGGDGFTGDNIFNDADNPWTRARREFFAPETEVGKATNTLARVATALIALPKFALRGIALPFQAAGKAKFLGGIADRLDDVGSFITKADDWMKSARTADGAKVQRSLAKLEQSFVKGSPASRAARIGAEADWLQLPLSDVAKVTAGSANLSGFAAWAENVQQSVRGLTQLGAATTASSKIKTVGQALGWDAFVAFNVFGEGDDEMDATMSDALYDLGLPSFPGLLTEGGDTAWARKSKQMVEGLAIGVAFNGLIDSYRAYKFAEQFRKAKPTEQTQILAAYGRSAQEIGESIGRRIELENRGVLTTDGNNVSGIRVRPIERPAGDARQEAIQRMREADAAAQAQVAPAAPPAGPGGALAPPVAPGPTLADLEQWLARQSEQQLTTAMQQRQLAQADELQQEVIQGMQNATLDSPVQQFLAVAEGRASAINPDDALFDRKYPPGRDLPPVETPESPGSEMVPTLPQGRGFNWDAMPPVQQAPAPGGPLADVNRIEPVRVEDLGPATPRPPSPIVTPQTIRSAFELEARRAWNEMERLTLTEGWDGVMRNIRMGVRRLMPTNRVDALEYLRKFPPTVNERGVMAASDSVWSNFISQKALAEGWARIDEDTLELYYNRKLAYEIDRGDAVTDEARAFDEFEALNDYQEAPVDVAESYRAAQQENPVEIDPTQTQKVAEAEADPAVAEQQARAVEVGKAMDQYDQWEASQEQARAADMEQAKAAYDQWEESRGKLDTANAAMQASDRVDAIDAAEELRLSQATKRGLAGETPDAVIVREMLGMDLGTAINAEVVKAETTRGWNVVDRNGEQLNPQRFSTQAKAKSFAEKENKRFRDALVARARQMEADGQDEAIGLTAGAPVLESDLVGTIQLTAPQLNAVRGLLPEVDAIITKGIADAANARGTGWFNVNDTNWPKKIELSQRQMNALSDAIAEGVQAGNFKGPAARALRNLADKLGVQVKLLEPQARAQKAVNDLLANVRQFDEHGEFCDYI